MAYVYRHIRTDKNQPFYIGVGLTDNGYQRAHQKSKTKRSEYWHNIAKNGYEVEILLDGLTDEQAFQKEIEFIALYGRSDNGTGVLCNLTDGGDRPPIRRGDANPMKCPELRARISKAMMGKVASQETRKRQSDAARARGAMPPSRKGCTMSRESIERATKSRIANGKRRKKLYQKTRAGDLVATWTHAAAAAESVDGWRSTSITAVACGRKPTAYGFVWSYEP